MGNYENLKQSITEVIKTNGNQEITGAVLQSTLLTIISTVGANATFAGIATPTTNPGTPDGSVFYLASEGGTYPNFGNIELQDGLSVLMWNGSWNSQQIFSVDDEPTANSDNLVKSGKIFNSILERTIMNDIFETGSSTGDHQREGDSYIYSGWLPKFLPEGTPIRVVFRGNLDNLFQLSFYNTQYPTSTGSYETFFASKHNLSGDTFEWIDKTKRDGYLMFNFTLNASISTTITVDVYADALMKQVERIDNLEVFKGQASNLLVNHKLLYFGLQNFKQPYMGQEGVNKWASVIHGVTAQEINNLFVQKILNTNLQDGEYIAFHLYKAASSKKEDIFAEDILASDIIIDAETYNAVAQYDIINIPLPETMEFLSKNYYTLMVDLSHITTTSYNDVKFGACDVRDAYNFICASYYTDVNSSDIWYEVSTNPTNKYNYGLLWGVNYGDGYSLNTLNDWQARLFINNQRILQESFEDYVASEEAKFADSVLETIADENTNGSASATNIRFNGYTLYAIKGQTYKFRFSLNDNALFTSMSVYFYYSAEAYDYGYKSVFEGYNPSNNTFEVTYVAPANGWFFMNYWSYLGASFTCEVVGKIMPFDTELEQKSAAGNNTEGYDNLVFVWFDYQVKAGKPYYIRRNRKGGNHYSNLSAYITREKGIAGDDYQTLFMVSEFANNSVFEFIPNFDGYLMFNFRALTDTRIQLQLFELVDVYNNQNFLRIQELQNKVAQLEASIPSAILQSYYEKGKTVASNASNKFPVAKAQFQDVYLALSGDSIFAFQSTFTKDDLGVAAVPPTCDKKAVANMLWNAIHWGNDVYRRFDWGKKSLVGQWDNTWADDSNAFFAETGEFKTEYIGKTRRKDPNFAGRVGPETMQVSTKIDEASFPYQFDRSEDSWWQRNIPKRFSNAANASISFTIPAGRSKFDFIYHAHAYGDVITISTNRNNGIVKVNTKPNDWNNAVEANGFTHDTSLANYSEAGGGNDAYGIPNMRLHFQIENTGSATTVTITKSSDTSKYLIYWGITYWGTSDMPYALHINNMAIGGYTQQAIYDLRSAMFKFIPHDAIILEICHNNLANTNFASVMASVQSNMINLKSYFENSLQLSAEDVGVWLPHVSKASYNNGKPGVDANNQMSEKVCHDLGFPVIANAKKICEDLRDTYYPNESYADFMYDLGNDGVHLGDKGSQIYKALWESLK